VEPRTSVSAVARITRDRDIGAVLVADGFTRRALATEP